MDTKLLDIIACPLCKAKLQYVAKDNELICSFDKLAYPVRDGIPILLEQEARLIPSDL